MTEKFWINPIERHCVDLLYAVMRELAADIEEDDRYLLRSGFAFCQHM